MSIDDESDMLKVRKVPSKGTLHLFGLHQSLGLCQYQPTDKKYVHLNEYVLEYVLEDQDKKVSFIFAVFMNFKSKFTSNSIQSASIQHDGLDVPQAEHYQR